MDPDQRTQILADGADSITHHLATDLLGAAMGNYMDASLHPGGNSGVNVQETPVAIPEVPPSTNCRLCGYLRNPYNRATGLRATVLRLIASHASDVQAAIEAVYRALNDVINTLNQSTGAGADPAAPPDIDLFRQDTIARCLRHHQPGTIILGDQLQRLGRSFILAAETQRNHNPQDAARLAVAGANILAKIPNLDADLDGSVGVVARRSSWTTPEEAIQLVNDYKLPRFDRRWGEGPLPEPVSDGVQTTDSAPH